MEKNPRRRNCSDYTRHSHRFGRWRQGFSAALSCGARGDLQKRRANRRIARTRSADSRSGNLRCRSLRRCRDPRACRSARRSRDIGCCGTLASSPAPHQAHSLARTRAPDHRQRRYRLRAAGSNRGRAMVEDLGASWALGLLFGGASYLNAMRVLASDAYRRHRGGTQARDLRVSLYTLAARALA